jgi:hypothetical protein
VRQDRLQHLDRHGVPAAAQAAREQGRRVELTLRVGQMLPGQRRVGLRDRH